MSEQPAESDEPPVEYQRPWWQSRGFTWGIVSIFVLLFVGWLVSAIFNPNDANTFASVVTGMLWSLAWLLALVIIVYAVSRVRQTSRTQEQ